MQKIAGNRCQTSSKYLPRFSSFCSSDYCFVMHFFFSCFSNQFLAAVTHFFTIMFFVIAISFSSLYFLYLHILIAQMPDWKKICYAKYIWHGSIIVPRISEGIWQNMAWGKLSASGSCWNYRHTRESLRMSLVRVVQKGQQTVKQATTVNKIRKVSKKVNKGHQNQKSW